MEYKSILVSRWLAVFVLIASALMAWKVALNFKAASEYERSKQYWPKVTGEIMTAMIEKGCDRGVRYRPKIKYSYTFANTLYENDMINGVVPCGTEQATTRLLEKYPSGSFKLIHVNPDVPSESFLELDTAQ